MDDFSLSHTKWKCQYHIVFIPKYRRKVMYGKVMEDVRAIIQTLCEYKKVRITAGAVMPDHVLNSHQNIVCRLSWGILRERAH